MKTKSNLLQAVCSSAFRRPFHFWSSRRGMICLLLPAQIYGATFSDVNWVSMGGIRGANGPVYAVVADGSDGLYVAGAFSVVGDVFATNIAKWNGSNWSALGWGVSNAWERNVSNLIE